MIYNFNNLHDQIMESLKGRTLAISEDCTMLRGFSVVVFLNEMGEGTELKFNGTMPTVVLRGNKSGELHFIDISEVLPKPADDQRNNAEQVSA